MQITTKQKLVYKVKEGDTLFSICKKFKVLEQDVLLLNQITSVQPNQILLLPQSYSFVYVVQPMDTYQKIAQKIGVSEQLIKEKTKKKKLFIGQKIVL